MPQWWPAQTGDRTIGAIVSVCLLVLVVTKFILFTVAPTLTTTVYIMVFVCIGWIVFQKPFWGIVLTAAALPVLSLLTSIPLPIPILFSVATLIILLGIIREGVSSDQLKSSFAEGHIWVFLFLTWIFVSHPKAATELGDTYSLWYLIPLAGLGLLTSLLLKTPKHHRTLMISFVVTSVVSAALAVWEAHFGASSETSIRGQGLTTQPGLAALWFLVSFVFILHLRESSTRTKIRFLYLILTGIIFLGIFATITRTAFLVFLVVLLLLFFSSVANKTLATRFIPIFSVLVIAALIISPQYWHIAAGIPYSILGGTDSIGFRYMQWESGLEMFVSHSISGVGIGQFTRALPFYSPELVPTYGLGYSAHSMYVAIFAETGTIGFLLYSCWLGSRVRSFALIVRQKHSEMSGLAWTWLLSIVVILLTGITGDVQYNKFFWIALSSPLLSMSRKVPQTITIPMAGTNISVPNAVIANRQSVVYNTEEKRPVRRLRQYVEKVFRKAA